MTGADQTIRISTAAEVLGVAGIAAYVSYQHAFEVVRAHGEGGLTARLEPATIDGLVYASSMVLLNAARQGTRAHRLAYGALGLGISATLAAGLSYGPAAALVAAWPAPALVISYEFSLGVAELSHDVALKGFTERFCNASAACSACCRRCSSAAICRPAPYATRSAATAAIGRQVYLYPSRRRVACPFCTPERMSR